MSTFSRHRVLLGEDPRPAVNEQSSRYLSITDLLFGRPTRNLIGAVRNGRTLDPFSSMAPEPTFQVAVEQHEIDFALATYRASEPGRVTLPPAAV